MTSSLWLSLIAMSILSLAFIIIPVIRGSRVGDADKLKRRKQNVDLFEQRSKELEEELAGRVIEQEEYERIKTELQRSFLLDMKALESGSKDKAQSSNQSSSQDTDKYSSNLLPLLSAAAVPLLSLFLYTQWGAGPDLNLPMLMENVGNSETAEEQELAFAELATALQARFDRHDDDIQNGYMLGTLYLQLERFSEASVTFKQLAEQIESPIDKATVLGQLAQSQYLSADQTMTDEVNATIGQTLALNPNEQAVMSLLAIESFLDGDVSSAMGYWRRQLAQLTPGSNDAIVLQQRIARVAELLPEESGAADTGATATESKSITLNVDVSEELVSQLDSSMRVFVFARNPDMPMPLAAQTFSIGELPLTITLDDSMAMMPQMTLSSAQTVIVGARISQSGQAIAQSGDFQSVSEPFELSEDGNEISLIISDIVP